MSLDKGIEYGKERRRKYNGSKRFERGCDHGNNCSHCRDGRQYNGKRRELSAKEILIDYLQGVDKE